MAKTNVKKRNWAMVVYPESAPENWKEIIEKTGLPAAISPLHDKDVNPDGTPKKPHWHVIVVFSGPTSFNVVKNLTESLNSPIPQPLESVKGYYRYFSHKDNPEKAQYDEREIRTINGFNVLDFTELTRAETLTVKMAIREIIKAEGFTEYAEIIDFLADSEMLTELEVASSNTLFFAQYLASRRNSEKPTPTKSTQKVHEKYTEICCQNCGSTDVVKRGKTSTGTQRFGCKDCGKIFTI